MATAHYDSILAGGAGLPLKYAVANRLVLSKIHARLGLERYTELSLSLSLSLSHSLSLSFFVSVSISLSLTVKGGLCLP